MIWLQFFILHLEEPHVKKSWKGPTSNVWKENECLLLAALTNNGIEDVDKCKARCEDGKMGKCNAIVYLKEPGSCYFYQCPDPIPSPSANSFNFYGIQIPNSVGYFIEKWIIVTNINFKSNCNSN